MVSFKDLKTDEFKGEFDCFCGQKHILKTEIIFSKNALDSLSETAVRFLPAGNILYITSESLKEKSKAIEKILYKTHMLNIFELPNIKPDLEHIASLNTVSEGCKLIVCFGGESAASIAKYFANLKGLPLICIVSDLSSVSYLAGFSRLYKNGLRQEYKTVNPDVLLVDLTLMLECPKNIIASGYGIVLGSALGLFDWQISNILNSENACDNITDLIKKALDNVKLMQSKLIDSRPDSIEVLIESLLYLNLAHHFSGQSICGSGDSVADMLGLILKYNKLHGELVYLSLNKLIKTYQMFLSDTPTDLLEPANFIDRALKLSELTCVHELEFLKEHSKIKEYNHELYIHKLLEYKDELANAINAADKTVSNTLTIFKRIYTDKGYSIQNCFSSEDFKRAVYLAPIADKQFSLLSFITDLGYLEKLAI